MLWNPSQPETTLMGQTSFTEVCCCREQNALQDLYSVSYMWYSVIGTLAVLVAALPVSAITGTAIQAKFTSLKSVYLSL